MLVLNSLKLGSVPDFSVNHSSQRPMGALICVFVFVRKRLLVTFLRMKMLFTRQGHRELLLFVLVGTKSLIDERWISSSSSFVVFFSQFKE